LGKLEQAMNTISLRTTTGIRALLTRLGDLPAGYDHVHFDSTLPGYGLRVRASGVHSLMVQYAVARRSRRVVLGRLDQLSPDRAFSTARDILAKVRLGGDPATDKALARARAEETFGGLLPRFLKHQQAKQKPRTFLETERHLMVQAKALHAHPVDGIERRTIAGRLANIAEKSGPAAANRCRASLSAYFTWLAREGYADANPVAFTNKAIEVGERKHVISDADLAKIWQALDDDASDYATIVKLLLLTGCRRDEIGSLRWSEIDLDAATIELPPERTKSRREFVVPLPPAAIAILKARPRQDGRDTVFGRGENGFRDWSGSKTELDAKLKGVAPWVLHDFRRSLSTTAHERLETLPHVVEALLGHVSGHQGGVAGKYNKAAYLDQRRRTLEAWGERIMALVADKPARGKVIDMSRRRR
jgi:integrase